MMTSLGAITIGQPCAWAIVKQEQANWSRPWSTNFHGDLLVHVGIGDGDKQWLQVAFGLSLTSDPPQGASLRYARMLTLFPRATQGCEGE